jgi:HD-like signal output (HDOD) protein
MVEKMPTFPASAHRIIELTADPNCAPRDLVGVIEHDPFLTLKVLKLINSSYFSLQSEVTSVKHAVVYLGINTIKNVALSVATIGALPKTNSVGFDMGQFWLHSLLVASLGQSVLQKKKATPQQLSNCFVSGLLHDVGKVVFVQFLPDEYKACLEAHEQEGTSLHQLEHDRIGVSHAELGALVSERWKLPGELVNAIRDNHSLEERTETSVVENGLCIGNVLSKLVFFEEEEPPAEYPDLPPLVADWIETPVQELLDGIKDLEEQKEKAVTFIEMSS